MQKKKRKKRRVKIKLKKKNFIIFIIFIILIIFGITKLMSFILKNVDTHKNKNEIIDKKNNKKEDTEKEKKLKELNNINKKVKYFKMNNLDRYINYKNKNPDKEIKQIIKDVNMDLDKEPYKDMIKATNLNSINILVNKHNYLTEDYVPENLENINSSYALSNMKMVSIAKNAFENLSKDEEKKNLKVIAMSTYRSYEYQVDLYNRYVKTDGKEAADTYSGRPGNSEHQTGLAVDVYNVKESYTNFEKTKEYTQYNGYKIGGLYLNIISMPKDKIPSGYSKVSFNYGDSKLEGYQSINNNVTYAADNSVKGSDFYLVYAINEVTGETGTYMYDKLDGTIQRFNSSLFLTYKEKADNYLLYFLLSLVTLATTIITFVIILMKKKKHKNKFA